MPPPPLIDGIADDLYHLTLLHVARYIIIKNRNKVKKTTAETDQTTWKRLRYTILRLANTSLHPASWHLSLRYGHVTLVSGFLVLTAVS